MIILFIVIANEALKCYGMRFCEPYNAVELTRLWEIGLIETLFEGVLGGVKLKIWRRLKDKFPTEKEILDRQDKRFN